MSSEYRLDRRTVVNSRTVKVHKLQMSLNDKYKVSNTWLLRFTHLLNVERLTERNITREIFVTEL